MSVTEGLETAKQWLTALATELKKYTRVAKAKRLNGLFPEGPSRVCFELHERNSYKTGPPRAETEQ